MEGKIICLFYRLQMNNEVIEKQSEQFNHENFNLIKNKIDNNENINNKIENSTKGLINNFFHNNNNQQSNNSKKNN